MNRQLRQQRGVALLVVLILLVMMSVLATRISQQFSRNLQKTHYQMNQQQLRWAIQTQEKQIIDLLQTEASGAEKPLSPTGIWTEPVVTRGDFYHVESQIEDAQTCFNINDLLAEDKESAGGDVPPSASEKSEKQALLEDLLIRAGLNTTTAEQVYEQLMDYLDADLLTKNSNQESDAYAASQPAHLPANQAMRTLGEIKLLPAFPADFYPQVSQLLCVLPARDSKININSLTDAQAPLLSALLKGKLNDDEAQRLLALRPETGWESMTAFEEQIAKQTTVKAEDLALLQQYAAINSQYFKVNSTGSTDDFNLRVVSQLKMDGQSGEVSVWQRRYRMVE